MTPTEKRIRTRRRNTAKRRAIIRQKPTGRLLDDGAGQPDAIRKRLVWFARERGIPLADLPTNLRTPTRELIEFCEAYRLSFNWVINGNLTDLRDMLSRPTPKQPPSNLRVLSREEFLRLLARLSPQQRDHVVLQLRSIVEGAA